MAAKTNGAKKTSGKKTSPERRALIMWVLLSSENGGRIRKT